MDPKMMEAIKKQRELMKKKQNGKTENNTNNLKKSKVITNDEKKSVKISLKDKIDVFEKSNKETQKNIDNFKSKGKGPPQKENSNNINKNNINNINNNIIINNWTDKPKKEKKLSKSFDKIFKVQDILTLQMPPKKYFKTIHILYNTKLDLNNFSIEYKKKNTENNFSEIKGLSKILELEFELKLLELLFLK